VNKTTATTTAIEQGRACKFLPLLYFHAICRHLHIHWWHLAQEAAARRVI
jgi:hypothetical protein